MIVILSDLPLCIQSISRYTYSKESSHIRSSINGLNLHDTISVDLESNFDLGDAARRRQDSRWLEFSQEVAVLGERPFALVYLDKNSRLVVGGSREAIGTAEVKKA